MANSQTSTGSVFVTEYAENADGTPLLDNGRFVPVFGAPAPFTILETWLPVRGATLDINTLSFYVNDSWAVNNHLTVNLGLRAEKVDSEATGGLAGIDTGAVVPRLAVAYDPRGDGQYTLQATYGHYAGKYSESQFASNTNVNNPNSLQAIYVGPSGQGLGFAPGFDPANYITIAGDFPVQNVFFDDNLKSPRTKEFTVSGGGALGSRGYAKLTYINRRAGDFVEDFITLDGGSTEITGDAGENFGTFSNITYRNTDVLERNYDGLEFQGRYRVADNFLIDGSYTVQITNEGNFEGEATSQPGVTSAAFDYPEVTPADRFFPLGRLDDFQRHKLRDVGHLQPRHRRRRDGRHRRHLALQLRPDLQHPDGHHRHRDPDGDPLRPRVCRWPQPARGVLQGPWNGELRWLRAVRPVGQLQHPGLGHAQPVDQVRPVQRVQQRQAD